MTGPIDAPAPQPNTATNSTSWLSSMTIWGTLLTAMTTVLPIFGVLVGVSITPDLADRLGQDIVLVVQAVGGLIGTVMALLGGSRAVTLLNRKPSRRPE